MKGAERERRHETVLSAVKSLSGLRSIPIKTEADARSRATIFVRVFQGYAHFEGAYAAANKLMAEWLKLLDDMGGFRASESVLDELVGTRETMEIEHAFMIEKRRREKTETDKARKS